MKLRSLEVSGFRAFATSQHFNLDADAIIVVGENGQGKTSLFDAIIWAICGSVPRLGEGNSVVSVFAAAGEARVALDLVGEDNSAIRIIRSSYGAESRLNLEVRGERTEGPEADSRILRLLWPQALSAVRPQEALVSALQRGVYLQQDRVRDFIDSQTDQERFATISELIGTGRINEMQEALERARRAWSQVTNTRAREAEELRQRAAELESQVTGLGTDDEAAPDRSRWNEWWLVSRRLGVVPSEVPSVEALDAPTRIDGAIRELSALRDAESRRRHELGVVWEALNELPSRPPDDPTVLSLQVEAAEAEAEHARVELERSQLRAAELRRIQIQQQETRAQLRTLARVALLHLADRCPVCNQEYNREETWQRLTEIVDEIDDAGDLEALGADDVAAAATRLQHHEETLTVGRHRLEEAVARLHNWEAQRSALARRAVALGLPLEQGDVLASDVLKLLEAADARIALLERQLREGEKTALALARAGQRARRDELARELVNLRSTLARREIDQAARQHTGAVIAKIIEALREASSEVVEAKLREIEPLLRRVYSTADPHPAFRVTSLLSKMQQGRGRVAAQLEDPVRDVMSRSPEIVLSSSQMNVLAVSIFLALNLGVSTMPLQTMILDDPLQSLDDLNLLGLVDLLRRIRQRRQLVLSTHDRHFAELLERKLRPIADEQRTLIIRLDGWSPEKVEVSTHEVQRDRHPMRVAI